MARIFISYRRADSSSLATLIAKDLEKQGINVFVDTRKVDGGGPFPNRLHSAIEKCDVFVCLLGETTLDSDWVLEEIKHAHEQGKVLIPVFQESYTAPDPIPTEHVYALLQSDGVHILDIKNIYVDEAIGQIGKMVKQSAPRRNLSTIWIIAVLILLIPFIFYGLMSLIKIISPPETSVTVTDTETSTPTNTATSTAMPIDTATNTATNTDTPSNTATNTPIPSDTPTPTNTPDPLLIAIEQAENFNGTQNSDWTPFEQEFDGVEMVLVPVGCFMMGSEDGDSDEQPVHPQCIEEPFWIDKYEVTNADFARLGGKKADPSSFSGANRPIETITWFEALEFCQLREGSLPTELQWEYAARGIDSLIYPWGNLWNNNYAVWGRDDSQGTANVGSITFGSTGKSWIGALDMSGNVWEWTSTIYGFDFNHDYDFTDTEDFTFNYPYNDNDGRELYSNEVAYRRVLRGGSWSFTNSMNLRSAIRYSLNPSDSSKSGGFRCVRPVD